MGRRRHSGPAINHLMDLMKRETDECIEDWPFSYYRQGYPRISIHTYRGYAAHHICLVKHGDPPDPTHHASHSCENRRCLNHRHIRWLTAAENIAERGATGQGDTHCSAKLTAAQVKQIRERRAESTLKDLAAEFGVSTSLIDAITHGKVWRYPEAGFFSSSAGRELIAKRVRGEV